jgi:hypothetical protein
METWYKMPSGKVRHSSGQLKDLEEIQDQIEDGRIKLEDYVAPKPKPKTWQELRREEYDQKSPYEQIEMMADGSFDSWYSGIKAKHPKG